jgi:hypothetical protein
MVRPAGVAYLVRHDAARLVKVLLGEVGGQAIQVLKNPTEAEAERGGADVAEMGKAAAEALVGRYVGIGHFVRQPCLAHFIRPHARRDQLDPDVVVEHDVSEMVSRGPGQTEMAMRINDLDVVEGVADGFGGMVHCSSLRGVGNLENEHRHSRLRT